MNKRECRQVINLSKESGAVTHLGEAAVDDEGVQLHQLLVTVRHAPVVLAQNSVPRERVFVSSGTRDVDYR